MNRILDNIPTPVIGVTLGPDSRMLFANRLFVQTFGYTPENLPSEGDFFLQAFPDPDVRDAARSSWDAAVESATAVGGAVRPHEFRILCKDGTPRDVILSGTVLDDMLLVSMVDVTERKRTEDRLRVSEERHRLLADNTRDVVWTMALDGRITYVSPAVQAVRGITSEEAMVQPIDEIHTPHSAAISLGYFTRLFAAIQAGRPPPTFRGELEYKRKDGTTFWTEVLAYPVIGADGKVAEILGVTRDISDRRRLEEASRLASMGTLVAGAAHEINNPLNGVLASDAFAREELARLREGLLSGAPVDGPALARELSAVEEALADSASSARRIADVVRDLTVLGRPDAGRVRVKVREAVDQALAWLPARVGAGAAIRVEDKGAPDVLGSPGEVVQVVVNLVANGVQAVRDGRGGWVTVRIGPGSAGMSRIEVVDEGCGITPEVMPRVFDPFFTTRPPGQGTGLGLAICRAIVTAHGGTLTAESEQGKGSTFRLELPIAPEAA